MSIDFRIKSHSFKRQKISIGSLNELLAPTSLVTVPEQKLSQKILPLSSINKQNTKSDSILNISMRSNETKDRRVVKLNIGKKIQLHEENKQESSYSKSGNKSSQWSSLKQDRLDSLIKRRTMPHFRYRSVDLEERKNARTAHNEMWRPVYYELMNKNQEKKHPESSREDQKQKLKQKQRKTQYLKKCSNINKRVVINLLKLKLQKKGSNFEAKDLNISSITSPETIKTSQILQMIRIYKGYGQEDESRVQKKDGRIRQSQQQKGQILFKDSFKARAFPLTNLNIQLSVSQWQGKKHSNANSPRQQEDIFNIKN